MKSIDIREDGRAPATDDEMARAKVWVMEGMMVENGIPQVGLELQHHFSKGVYARELFIPKGTLLTGHVHKYPQMNILLQGDISVLVDGSIVRLQAPQIVCSPAGTKRIAFTHEDSIWVTVHGTELTDLDAIEDRFIAKTEADYIAHVEQERIKCLG